MTLNDMKLYLRVDSDVEDSLILDLMDSAVNYMAGAIDDYEAKKEASSKWKNKAEQAERLLVADWFENRTEKERPANSNVSAIITQLQL